MDNNMTGRPRLNPDRATTTIERSAAYKARMMTLTPLERCARNAAYLTTDADRWNVEGVYTSEEGKMAAEIRHHAAELARLTADLNNRLKVRLADMSANPGPSPQEAAFLAEALPELEKITRITIPTY
jgi:hypothetical protein